MMDISKSSYNDFIEDYFPAYDAIPRNFDSLAPRETAKLKFKKAVIKLIQELRRTNFIKQSLRIEEVVENMRMLRSV